MTALDGFLTGERHADAAGAVSVDAILDAMRRHLGMEIAFASRIADGKRHFTHIRADIALPLAPGDAEPLEDSLCQRVLDGRLPALMYDAHEHASALECGITAALPVGSHLNVPLKLSDGSIYGTFCCLSRTVDRTLSQRDMDTVHAFAGLAATQIERELDATRQFLIRRGEIEGLIARGLPAVHYQPIHRRSDGVPVGVESLARFADHGSRCPSAWFAEAAELGLGVELELSAIRSAIAAASHVPAPHYVSVNVAPETLFSESLIELLAEAPRGRMVVELTEHARVASYPALRARLDRLREHARIAIDDVGAGYAGLRHIIDLAPDIIKLDIALIRDVDADPARQALVSAMVTFATRIGASIVAEGVETPAEEAMLQSLGIAYAQGWRFSRAMPPVAVQQLLMGATGLSEPMTPVAVRRAKRAA